FGLFIPIFFAFPVPCSAEAIYFLASQDTTALGESTTPEKYGTKQVVDSAGIEFAKGSKQLTSAQKAEIRDLVKSSHAGGTTMIGIAAWSDTSFPGAKGELSKKDEELAEARAKAVKEFINEIDYGGSVETYNMAKGANWLSRALNTSDAEVKEGYTKKDSS